MQTCIARLNHTIQAWIVSIGKMTLYRHYPSKDDLIVAYLKDSDELF